MKFWNIVRTAVVIAGFGLCIGLFVGHLTKPKVICKVCHCGKEKCAAACSEENMCALRCERECEREKSHE